MRQYTSKTELIEAINLAFERFYSEFLPLDEKLFHLRTDGVDKSPFEMISYQIGWLNLLLSWDNDERAGKCVVTPKIGVKWNELGKLYREFYAEFMGLSKLELLERFLLSKNSLIEWINSLSEEELFSLNARKWAGKKWNLTKWIHINSVAPFTNFRIKIRKFKKETSSLI